MFTLASLVLACTDNTVIVGKFPGSSGSPRGPDADQSESGAEAVVDASAPQRSDASISTGATRPGGRADLTRYAVSIEASNYSEFCSGSGSVLVSTRADGSQADCEARVERRLFGYGLCACEELRFEGESFLIDSFDSSAGGYSAGQTGGNVGVGSTRLTLASTTEILGSLSVAGTGMLTLAAASFVVSGDLKSSATLQVSGGAQRVARDLWARSDVVVSQGSLLVERDSYQTPGRAGLDAVSVGGTKYPSEFEVPEPCHCAAAAPVDVAALVTQAREHNDNAAVSFDPSSLDVDSLVTDARFLPCGRLYGTSLTLNGGSTFVWGLSGRTALFVEGDLRVGELSTLMISGPLSGELDLLISGNIVVSPNSTLVLGIASRPAALRVFVAGQIEAQGTISLGAQLYAPNASFTVAQAGTDTEQYGAVFARSIAIATKRFHYDRAILHSAPACAAAAPVRCASCHECPDGLACTTGSCQPCAADADCCEPAVCQDGKCQTLVSDWP